MKGFLAWWVKPAPIGSWTAYWFRPAPLFDLAVCRILLVGTQLVLLLWYSKYSVSRLAIYAELDDQMYLPHPLLRVLMLPFGLDFRPDLDFLIWTRYIAIGAGILAMIGLLTHVSLVIFFYSSLILILHFFSYGDFHHTDAPLVLALGFVILSPAGRVLSIDRLLRGGSGGGTLTETSPYARWPILLGQWMFALIYLSAFLEKLFFTGGLDWVNGYTLMYHMAHDSLWRGSVLGLWMQQHWALVLLGQLTVVAFQGTFWVSLLLPRLKLIYVPLGFTFHVINILALNAIFWEWIGTYAIFVPWALAARFALRSSGGRGPVVAQSSA
jgi:hypothetical protein